MATFMKRQKEMKRLEKQREKAERRAQRKLAARTAHEPSAEIAGSSDDEASGALAAATPVPEQRN